VQSSPCEAIVGQPRLLASWLRDSSNHLSALQFELTSRLGDDQVVWLRDRHPITFERIESSSHVLKYLLSSGGCTVGYAAHRSTPSHRWCRALDILCQLFDRHPVLNDCVIDHGSDSADAKYDDETSSSQNWGIEDFNLRLAVATALSFSAGVARHADGTQFLNPLETFASFQRWTAEGHMFDHVMNLGVWPLRFVCSNVFCLKSTTEVLFIFILTFKIQCKLCFYSFLYRAQISGEQLG
jgi:hypothetical protein